MTMTALREACSAVADMLQADPTAALNESELQALLQIALLDRLPDRVEASLSLEVLARSHHPSLTVPRVYRELKPDGGRGGMEVDLAVLQDRHQIVRGKGNGAPAKFEPPYSLIIETKIDASALNFAMGRTVRTRAAALAEDLNKWHNYVANGMVDGVVSVVMTAQPEAYEALPNVIAINRPLPPRCEPFEHDVIDPWPLIDRALRDVAEEYRRHPVGLLREKDFESRLFGILRSAHLPRAPFWLPDGTCVSIDPVRAQWSGQWANSLGRGRRHDLIVLHPSGRSLLAEVELKTSHSDSHNWFRKREVEAEIQAMHHLVEVGKLHRGRFVMFRYGTAKWEADAEVLFTRYPNVEFSYVCA